MFADMLKRSTDTILNTQGRRVAGKTVVNVLLLNTTHPTTTISWNWTALFQMAHGDSRRGVNRISMVSSGNGSRIERIVK